MDLFRNNTHYQPEISYKVMTESIDIIGWTLAISLGLVHLFISRGRWLAAIPKKWWISAAGGVSIAYIFLDILPELGAAQTEVEHSNIPLIEYLENHVYLLALLGLALFYGLEKLALKSRTHRLWHSEQDCTHPEVFWLHITAFALYNAILGYLLREAGNHGLLPCLLLFFTLVFHFVVNDVSLREHHKQSYDRVGRWWLAGAILFGWVLGQVVHLNEVAITAIWSVMAGGIILNVLKEELPEEQESHFGMFLAGAAFYSVILLSA